MNNIKFYITLTRDAALSLQELAFREKRDPQQQAALMIEEDLHMRGLLRSNKSINDQQTTNKLEETSRESGCNG